MTYRDNDSDFFIGEVLSNRLKGRKLGVIVPTPLVGIDDKCDGFLDFSYPSIELHRQTPANRSGLYTNREHIPNC
jgi:hypothetical protein